MAGISDYAQIALPVAIHDTLTYRIPDSLKDATRLGSRVEVPLGPRFSTGFVVGLVDQASVDAAKVKPIRSVLDDEEPALIPEIIDLCRWSSEYYIAPLGEMLRVSLPANMAARGRREAILTDPESDRILPADLPLIQEHRKRSLPLSTIFDDLKFSRSA